MLKRIRKDLPLFLDSILDGEESRKWARPARLYVARVTFEICFIQRPE